MNAAYDVVVVGGGPIGAACARELALAGRRVLTLDPEGENGQGWKAAAGMLAPQLEAEAEDPLLELGLAAREHYGPLAEALRESIGSDIGLWREGIAWVASDETEAGQPAHGFPLAYSTPRISWVRVSRVTLSQLRQPKPWYQSSWCGPAGLSRR